MGDTESHTAPEFGGAGGEVPRSSQVRQRPKLFGKYELLERVRSGGMAEVFRAREAGRPERLFAIKRILPSFTGEADYVAMFVAEARLGLRLRHPNIARAYELGQVDDQHYIAFEYVHGRDVGALLRRARECGTSVPVAVACRIVREVCAALHYAHELRDELGAELAIVHRDVSPHNVLVSFDGDVKLIDFGIAKSAEQLMRTQAGLLKGKYGYLSPEQAHGWPVDRRSDVFSAGICLYEMLAGSRLFEGSSDFSTLARVRSAEVPELRDRNPNVPDELAAIVERALALDPGDRFATAADLGAALDRFVDESGERCDREGLARYLREAFAGAFAEEARLDELRDAGTGLLSAFDDLEPVSAISALTVLPDAGAADFVPTRVVAYESTVSGELAGEGRGPLGGPVPAAQVPGPAAPSVAAGIGVDWDDDELCTQIYDPPEDELDARDRASFPAIAPPAARSAPPPAARSAPPAAEPAAFARSSPPGSIPPGMALPLAQPAEPSRSSGAPPGFPAFAAPSARHTTTPPPPAARQAATGPAVWLVAGGIALTAVIVPATLLLTRPPERAAIRLTTHPSDAIVTLDGVRQGGAISPFVLDELEPGRSFEIEVSKRGYRTWRTRLTLSPGQEVVLPRVQLLPEPSSAAAPAAEPIAAAPARAEPAPAKPAPAETAAVSAAPARDALAVAPPPRPRSPAAGRRVRARPTRARPAAASADQPAAPPAPAADTAGATAVLRINSRPWSRVFVDGRLVGSTPQLNLVLGAGRHTITLVNPDFDLKRVLTVDLKRGETVTKIVDLAD